MVRGEERKEDDIQVMSSINTKEVSLTNLRDSKSHVYKDRSLKKGRVGRDSGRRILSYKRKEYILILH